jgi:hypothetical protein
MIANARTGPRYQNCFAHVVPPGIMFIPVTILLQTITVRHNGLQCSDNKSHLSSHSFWLTIYLTNCYNARKQAAAGVSASSIFRLKFHIGFFSTGLVQHGLCGGSCAGSWKVLSEPRRINPYSLYLVRWSSGFTSAAR